MLTAFHTADGAAYTAGRIHFICVFYSTCVINLHLYSTHSSKVADAHCVRTAHCEVQLQTYCVLDLRKA